MPIALGILAASDQIPYKNLVNHEFIGELALSGELRGVTAIIPVVLAAHKDKQQLIIASANAAEASLAGHEGVFTANNLTRSLWLSLPGDPTTKPASKTRNQKY